MERGAPDEATQDVAAALVRRRDVIGYEERGGAGVLRDHPDGHVLLRVRPVLRAAQGLDLLDERLEQVGLERVGDALQHLRGALETGAGVDVPLGQRHQGPVLLAVVLLEDEVPDLEIPAAALARIAVVRRDTRLWAAVDEDLAAGAAQPGRARRPEVRVVALREVAEPEHPFRREECQLLRPDVVGLLVVEVDGRDERLRVDLELLGEQLPAPGDRFLLPVVADPEVAEHLEEGVVIRIESHDVEVGGAEAFLDGDDPLRRRLLLPEEVRDDRLHARTGEQHARVVPQDERRAGHAVMPLLLEELDEALADGLTVQAVHPFR